MLNRNLKKIFLLLFILLLIGCGGGGGASSDSNPSNENINIQGKIVDGEISGATIFLDLNLNGTLDSDEPIAISKSDGTYSLVLTATQQADKNYKNKRAPLIVYGGVDIRTGEDFNDYLSGFIEDVNSTNITPLTTLIAQSLEENLSSEQNVTLAQIETKMSTIKKNLADLFELQEDLLTKDPIALAQEGDISLLNNALQLHKVSKVIKKAMKGEAKNVKKSILTIYRTLAKELKKLKKSAITSGNTALTEALNKALDENIIFDQQLVAGVKRESGLLIKDIDDFWQGRQGRISNSTLTTLIKDVEVNIVEQNRTIQKPSVSVIPTSTQEDNTTVTVNAEVGSTIFVNGIQIGTIGVGGSYALDLNTSGENELLTFSIVVKDALGNESSPLYLHIVRGILSVPSNIDDKTVINFLSHVTFGATEQSKKELKDEGIVQWLGNQLSQPYVENMHLTKTINLAKRAEPTKHTESLDAYLADNDTVFNRSTASFTVAKFQMSAWFDTALFAPDQLRHKVAYALSQIVVVSTAEPFFNRRAEALATYMDILTKNAFGNYKDLLIDISHSAAMGLFLTYNGSKKEQVNGTTTIYPDENYARELMQLFTIGLSELNIDGTLKVDANGDTIPTYGQQDVNEMAKVFTGWDTKRSSRFGRVSFSTTDVTHPLEFTAEYHEMGEKTILGQTIQAGNDGSADIEAAIDILMSHPNIGPFVSKQLIMRLVTSNPTPAYVARVATVFNDNGKGVKGDLSAVLRAIFLDEEFWQNSDVKKFKEPLVAYVQFLRAFKVAPLPIWRLSKTGSDNVTNALFMRDTTAFLGQSPTRSFTVFNFYSNSYVPNDTSFQQQKLLAPELQIQTDSMLIAFNNKVSQDLLTYEKGDIMEKYGTLTDIESLVTQKFNPSYSLGRDKFLLDCSDEYAVMEAELEPSVDGVFNSFNRVRRSNDTTKDANGVTNRDRALLALIELLDKKLTGGLLSQEEKDALFNGYKDVFYYNGLIRAENPKRKIYETIIARVIAAIVTSEIFMVQ
jgi:uncharacterized protein (DUF1800 family)